MSKSFPKLGKFLAVTSLFFSFCASAQVFYYTLKFPFHGKHLQFVHCVLSLALADTWFFKGKDPSTLIDFSNRDYSFFSTLMLIPDFLSSKLL